MARRKPAPFPHVPHTIDTVDQAEALANALARHAGVRIPNTVPPALSAKLDQLDASVNDPTTALALIKDIARDLGHDLDPDPTPTPPKPIQVFPTHNPSRYATPEAERLFRALPPGEGPGVTEGSPGHRHQSAGASQPANLPTFQPFQPPHEVPPEVANEVAPKPPEVAKSLLQVAKKENATTPLDPWGDLHADPLEEDARRRDPRRFNRDQRMQYYLEAGYYDLLDEELEAARKRQDSLQPRKPYRGPVCNSSTSKGDPCRNPVDDEDGLCYFHDPAKAEQRRESQRLGGISSGESRRGVLNLLEPRVATLSDPLAIQVILDAVLRLEMLGKMTDSRGKRLGKLLALAVKNVGRDGMDPAAYTARRKSLDHELSDIVRHYEREDIDRYYTDLRAVHEKRTEYLKANELFQPAS